MHCPVQGVMLSHTCTDWERLSFHLIQNILDITMSDRVVLEGCYSANKSALQGSELLIEVII